MGLKRLSLEEAQHLIRADHDQTDAPVYGFTLTPSIDPQMSAEGWETVTYYTNRKVRNKIPVGMQGSQWIYVLSNETMPDIVKIGFTKIFFSSNNSDDLSVFKFFYDGLEML